MYLKKLTVFASIFLSSLSMAKDTNIEKAEALKKIDDITNYYLEEVARTEKKDQDLSLLIENLEKELESLKVASEEIEIRKNVLKELYVDLEDTKNLFLLEFDKNGNIKKEIRDAALIIKQSLSNDAKIVKVKLANGKYLPLVKYKIKKNDTLKKILLKTYPNGYKPTWKEISKRIDTLVKINKNIIKMNYIYPNQIIYVPLFNDNPNKEELKSNIIKQKKKHLKTQQN